MPEEAILPIPGPADTPEAAYELPPFLKTRAAARLPSSYPDWRTASMLGAKSDWSMGDPLMAAWKLRPRSLVMMSPLPMCPPENKINAYFHLHYTKWVTSACPNSDIS